MQWKHREKQGNDTNFWTMIIFETEIKEWDLFQFVVTTGRKEYQEWITGRTGKNLSDHVLYIHAVNHEKGAWSEAVNKWYGKLEVNFQGSFEDNLMTPKQKENKLYEESASKKAGGWLPLQLKLYTSKATLSFLLHQADMPLKRIETYFLYAPQEARLYFRLVGHMISLPTTHLPLWSESSHTLMGMAVFQ